MSTKNLARTVIEGGRYNTFQRRQTNADHRCAERQALAREVQSEDFGDVVYPMRQPVPRAFDDKLAPAMRWLSRQVGRRWDNVRGALFERFDTRTTAGRHIIYCHMLESVETGAVHSRWRRFWVDEAGVLRRYERSPLFARFRPPLVPQTETAWLGRRCVGQRQHHFYWFEPTVFGGFRQGRELTSEEVNRFQRLPQELRERQDPLLNPCSARPLGTPPS